MVYFITMKKYNFLIRGKKNEYIQKCLTVFSKHWYESIATVTLFIWLLCGMKSMNNNVTL